MQNSSREQSLQSLAAWLLEHGGDITCVDPNGDTACSLMFKARHGIEFLESCMYRYIDLLEFRQSAALDSLIFSAIAHSLPQFGLRLRKQLEEFSTPPAISSRPHQNSHALISFNTEHHLMEIRQASKAFRVQFIRGICRQGNTALLEPLVCAGFDVEERTHDSPSYLEEAVQQGNYETAVMLLGAGAKVWGEWSALDVLIERWKSMDPVLIKSEQKLFDRLLEHTHVRCPNALTRAIFNKLEYCSRRLAEKGFARKPQDKIQGCLDMLNGSEVMEAVKFDDIQALRMLLEYNSHLEFEDRSGYTPLMQALDKGRVPLVQCLVNGGARCLQLISKKCTAWDVATRNLHGSHPRKSTLSGASGYIVNQPTVSYETDLEMYKVLERAKHRESGPQGTRGCEYSISLINEHAAANPHWKCKP